MTHIKVWSRCDWGTWALPLYVTHLTYDTMVLADGGPALTRPATEHIVSIRVLCFAIFVEWSR
jgi:hypothetical protein